MLGTFLEKAEGLLSKRFLIAYWFPIFACLSAGMALRAWVYGWAAAWGKWQSLIAGEDLSAQLWLLLGFLLAITIPAYLLQAFTRPVVQFYEGYLWPAPLRRWRTRIQQQRQQKWREKAQQDRADEAYERFFYGFPTPAEQLLPTRLGNTIRATENYGVKAYGMALPFWWPRLWLLLPEAEQEAVEGSLTQLVALLNLATLWFVVTLDGAIYLLLCQTAARHWWWLVLLGGLLLAWACYTAAIVQARSYGQRLRAATDLHRFALLKSLHLPLPQTPAAERVLWAQLRDWLYGYDLGTAHALQYRHEGEPPDKPEEVIKTPPTLWRIIKGWFTRGS